MASGKIEDAQDDRYREAQLREALRRENRMLRQELFAQRRLIETLRAELKALNIVIASLMEKTDTLLQAQQMRTADLELMMYTIADKYMPGNEEFLGKPHH